MGVLNIDAPRHDGRQRLWLSCSILLDCVDESTAAVQRWYGCTRLLRRMPREEGGMRMKKKDHLCPSSTYHPKPHLPTCRTDSYPYTRQMRVASAASCSMQHVQRGLVSKIRASRATVNSDPRSLLERFEPARKCRRTSASEVTGESRQVGPEGLV